MVLHSSSIYIGIIKVSFFFIQDPSLSTTKLFASGGYSSK